MKYGWWLLIWFMLGIIVGSLVGWRLPARAEHRPSLRWMTGYTSATHMPCCSELDCIPAPVAVQFLPDDDTQRLVTVRGETFRMPAASVHHSEDGRGYWCYKDADQPPSPDNSRCIFWTEGT